MYVSMGQFWYKVHVRLFIREQGSRCANVASGAPSKVAWLIIITNTTTIIIIIKIKSKPRAPGVD